ncbi:MAG: hypothetical protein ACK4YP_13620, partial [Myxococcota bacterium]
IATLGLEEPAVEAPPPIEMRTPSVAAGPSTAGGPPAEVSVEVEDTGEAAFFAAGASPDTEPTLAAAAPSVPDADADEPVAPRPRPAPAGDDPVPDQWVVGSIAVFTVVAVLAAAWTLT